MTPDAIDIKILGALMDDARASYRQIARRTSLTTPTVSARMARMMKAGLIKKFVPILSAESVNNGVMALVTLKADSASAQKVAGELAKLGEVESVYMTTGQGITLKVTLESVQGLQPFLASNILKRRNVEITSSQIIIDTVKEDPHSTLPTRTPVMNLKCDDCGGDVTSNRPYTIAAGPSHYYFCCKTCKKAYLERNGNRLARIPASST